MSRYPEVARAASVKCIPCNAPATETVDGEFVCVACGTPVVRARAGDGSVVSGADSADPALRRNGATAVADGSGSPADPGRVETEPYVPTTDGGLLESAEGRPRADASAPAVAVIAPAEWSDAVVRTVARAVNRGHAVLLTYREEPDPELVDVARRLGATIVRPPEERDDDSLTAALGAAGRELSVPGVIVQTEPYARIDYARSVAAVGDDEYVVDVIPESGRTGQHVVAAIPAWNEADSIGDVVRTAALYVDEVVVVDDGSVDGTRERAEAAGATVVRHRRNRGYGAALKTAFREAKARNVDRLVIIDGDGQHDGTDVPLLLSALDDRDADVVIGSRFVQGSETTLPRYRRFGISVINLFMNVSVGAIRPSAFIRDTQSGFRAYRSEVVDVLAETPGISDDMEASVDVLYHVHTNGFRIEEVGTTMDYTVESPSSRNPIAHGFGIVRTLLRTIERDHPLTTLGLPGLLSLSAGFGLVLSLVTAAGPSATGPGVAIASVVLLSFGIVATLAAAVLHGFNLNREYFDR